MSPLSPCVPGDVENSLPRVTEEKSLLLLASKSLPDGPRCWGRFGLNPEDGGLVSDFY